MEIRTYTRIWTAGKTIYTIGDITLPRPVSLLSLGVFVLGIIIWTVPLFMLFSLPMGSPYTWILALSVPGVLAWASNKPMFENKPLFEYVVSQSTYLNEKPYLVDMRPTTEVDGQLYVNIQKIYEPEPRHGYLNYGHSDDSKGRGRKRRRRK